jgi:hypothetical protein
MHNTIIKITKLTYCENKSTWLQLTECAVLYKAWDGMNVGCKYRHFAGNSSIRLCPCWSFFISNNMIRKNCFYTLLYQFFPISNRYLWKLNNGFSVCKCNQGYWYSKNKVAKTQAYDTSDTLGLELAVNWKHGH